MSDVIERLAAVRIVPVLTAADADQAEHACRALLAGGLSAIEITFRTDEETADPGGTPNRLGRGIGAKCDLDNRQPALEQRVTCPFGLVGVIRGEQGHDPQGCEPLDDLAHRASQPPSTGSTMP